MAFKILFTLMLQLGILCLFPHHLLEVMWPGVLTICNTNHLGGYLVHKHKTIKFVVQATTKYIQIYQTSSKDQIIGIASNHSPYFLNFPKQNNTNHLIFWPKFPDFPYKWLVPLVFCLHLLFFSGYLQLRVFTRSLRITLINFNSLMTVPLEHCLCVCMN